MGGRKMNEPFVTAAGPSNACHESPREELSERFAGPTRWWTYAFERSVMGQSVSDLDGRYIKVNDQMCKIVGYSREALLAMNFRSITHVDDLAAAEDLQHAMLSGRIDSGHYEKRYVRPDGLAIWARVTVTLIRDTHGAPECLVASIEDIDARKRLELMLRERDALLRSLSSSLPCALMKVSVDAHGALQDPYLSDNILELLELREQDVQADFSGVVQRIHEQDKPALMRWLTQARRASLEPQSAARGPQVLEYRVKLPTKGERHLYTSLVSEREPNGDQAWYGFTLDVTDQKRYALAQVQAQAAAAASQAKTDFLSRMSHELRTPLNAVLGFSHLLRVDSVNPLTPTQLKRVSHIERAGSHLLALLMDVLDLSKIEAGNLNLSVEDLQVEALLDEALGMVVPAAREANIELRPIVATPGILARADRTRLRQVFVNLLSNAIKYNLPGGSVSCEVSVQPRHVEVLIRDTGRGLTEQQREHLFEPFNRLGAEGWGIEGTGIGLVIVQRLLHLMGADIDIDSHVDRGTLVRVSLLPAQPAMHVAQPTARAPAARAQGGGHILYVEDNAVNALLVQQALQSRPSYRLTVVDSGAAAIAAAADLGPDLILLDMHLGDMSGLDVARALGKDPRTAAIPRVAVSADAMPSSVQNALACGFVDYLTKPLDLDALIACLDGLSSMHGLSL